jgi:Rab-GTPase-TBC domain
MFYKNYKSENLRSDYLRILEYEGDENMNRQIRKDVDRTHPMVPYFSKGSESLLKLEKVLQCVAKYDISVWS